MDNKYEDDDNDDDDADVDGPTVEAHVDLAGKKCKYHTSMLFCIVGTDIYSTQGLSRRYYC